MSSWYEKLLDLLGLSDKDDGDLDTSPQDFEEEFRGHKRAPVVSIHTSPEVKIVVVAPASFEEAEKLAGHLKSRKPLVVNFANASREIAQRLLDFLSGTVYALNGNMQRIDKETFLFVPSNIIVCSEGVGSNLREQLHVKID
ncbi:cell division protein SepF [Thermacetogenium phaeum DSM 12270]|uniref:Cell division protein SepF n=1 Tax=Thermacetogenium phaeum (strain ATCC BAA-254 / DSM 26808 / PB) TaxID=1089553 RepID=K4LHS0_THEPS|nr:cell division protein SepF [Thermacetogenium phaeum]AFV11505.1 cell division protein SepF [Thermacetogenium phaeum DSM 12270]